jgi:hypothetical protein
MYYRVAQRKDPLAVWQWISTPLSSLHSLFQFLRLYQAFAPDHLRVFSARSRQYLNGQLKRENQGLASSSVIAGQFLQERMISFPAGHRGETGSRTLSKVCPASPSVAVAHVLHESRSGTYTLDQESSSLLEKRRRELEFGRGGDHDIPYRFTLPNSIPHILAWMKLLAKVQHGELQP